MGQTVVVCDTQSGKKDIFARSNGTREFFRAMYRDEVHYVIDGVGVGAMFRPSDFAQARTWAKSYTPALHETDPVYDLMNLLESNEHLWIYEVW